MDKQNRSMSVAILVFFSCWSFILWYFYFGRKPQAPAPAVYHYTTTLSKPYSHVWWRLNSFGECPNAEFSCIDLKTGKTIATITHSCGRNWTVMEETDDSISYEGIPDFDAAVALVENKHPECEIDQNLLRYYEAQK